MRFGGRRRLPDVDRPRIEIDVRDLADLELVPRPHLATRTGHLLRRKAIPGDRTSPRAANARHVFKPAERRRLIERVRGGKLDQTVELPPDGLVLASMELEELRKQPACVLFRRSL